MRTVRTRVTIHIPDIPDATILLGAKDIKRILSNGWQEQRPQNHYFFKEFIGPPASAIMQAYGDLSPFPAAAYYQLATKDYSTDEG